MDDKTAIATEESDPVYEAPIHRPRNQAIADVRAAKLSRDATNTLDCERGRGICGPSPWPTPEWSKPQGAP